MPISIEYNKIVREYDLLGHRRRLEVEMDLNKAR